MSKTVSGSVRGQEDGSRFTAQANIIWTKDTWINVLKIVLACAANKRKLIFEEVINQLVPKIHQAMRVSRHNMPYIETDRTTKVDSIPGKSYVTVDG